MIIVNASSMVDDEGVRAAWVRLLRAERHRARGRRVFGGDLGEASVCEGAACRRERGVL